MKIAKHKSLRPCNLRCFALALASLVAMFAYPGPANAQFGRFDYVEILAKKDTPEARAEIEAFIQRNHGSPEAAYLRAVIEEDGQRAMELYNQFKVNYPKSPLVANATFHMGHYYLARGLYISARRFFLEIVEQNQDSKLVPDAMYFAAACMCAAKQFDTCRAELKNFLEQYRGSDLAELAREDLRDMSEMSGSADVARRINAPDGNYTLQVGAFSQTNHALNLRNYFEKLGFPVEVREKVVDGSTVYVVLVGSFRTQDEARDFGEDLKKDHGKLYRIVSK